MQLRLLKVRTLLNNAFKLGFKCFQRLLSMQFIHSNVQFLNIYHAFYNLDICTFKQETVLKNKINKGNGGFSLVNPGCGLYHLFNI